MGRQKESEYALALQESGLTEIEVAQATETLARYNRAVAEVVGHAVDAGDLDALIAAWELNKGKHGLPESKRELAAFAGCTVAAINKRLKSEAWRQEYLRHNVAADVVNEYFVPALHNLGRRAAYDPEAPGTIVKQFFQLAGMFVADKDSENGVRRSALAQGDVEGWSQETTRTLLGAAMMQVYFKKVDEWKEAVVKAVKDDLPIPDFDHHGELFKAQQASLVLYMSGSLGARKEVVDADYDEIAAPSQTLLSAAAGEVRREAHGV